jgi:hypothetical protein
VALVRTEVTEELFTSITRVNMIMEEILLPKRRFLLKPHDVTSQKAKLFTFRNVLKILKANKIIQK